MGQYATCSIQSRPIIIWFNTHTVRKWQWWNIHQILNSQTMHPFPPSWTRCGASVVSISEKNDSMLSWNHALFSGFLDSTISWPKSGLFVCNIPHMSQLHCIYNHLYSINSLNAAISMISQTLFLSYVYPLICKLYSKSFNIWNKGNFQNNYIVHESVICTLPLCQQIP